MIPSSREGLAAFDTALYDACAMLRPPEKLTASEWADKYGMLSSEGSAQPGKWYTSNAEYQREPLDALSDPRFQTVVLMWSSQVGKTAIGLFGAQYYAQHDPCPQLLVQPTEDMAKTVVKDRIAPAIRDTPVLRPLFRKNRGDEWNHKPFPGGQISMGWANSPAQLASRAVRFAWTDEEGRYGQNIEGDPVDQVTKRLATYKGRRKHLRTSSPALRKTCRITKAYANSDQRRYYVACPQCDHFQTLRWENLKWVRVSAEPDNHQLADCYYVCESSGCEIRESDKYAMIRAGEWRAENPGGGDGRTAGFHLNALYSTIGYEWTEIVQAYLKCQGIPDKLQVFTNTVLAEPWDEQAEGADLNEIAKHAEEYSAQAPGWVLIVTTGVDVQRDRIEATKWGWGVDDVSGVIEHRVFRGETSQRNRGAWVDFDFWRKQKVEHESGLLLPISCTFIDSGDGNRTQTVYEYCRPLESQRVYACKGSSLTGSPLVSRGTRVGKNKTILVIVGSSTAKDTIYSRLQIGRGKPGYIYFPKSAESGCDPEFYSHLKAEALVTRQTKGGEVSRWEKQRRNEALDCAVYALAAKEFTRAPMKLLARKLVEKAARLTPAESPAANVQSLSSPGYSLECPSPAAARPLKQAKKGRKLRTRPGFRWIHGN